MKILSVALRKEGVDRNSTGITHHLRLPVVALRKEGVDRNFSTSGITGIGYSRPPQGGRG